MKLSELKVKILKIMLVLLPLIPVLLESET